MKTRGEEKKENKGEEKNEQETKKNRERIGIRSKKNKKKTLPNITGEYETQRVQSDRLIIWEWPLRLKTKRSTACRSLAAYSRGGSDDTTSWVSGPERPVEQRQATPLLITPQRHEENHSAVSNTHIHWEHRLILFPPLVSGGGDFLMNQERFLKHLVPFALPSQFHLRVKSPFVPRLNQWRKLIWIDPGDFGAVLCDCSDSNILMREHISSPHWYAPLRRRLIWYLRRSTEAISCSRR